MYNPNDFERFPVRKHPRMKHFDYSSCNYYFVTICTHDKKCIFGKPGENNNFRDIAEQGLLRIPEHFPDTTIEKFVVMPNHVHILLLLSGGKSSLGNIIGTWKAYVTREIHKIQPDLKVWQASFHDHIIRHEDGYQKIWLYIEGNPMNWKQDCFYLT